MVMRAPCRIFSPGAKPGSLRFRKRRAGSQRLSVAPKMPKPRQSRMLGECRVTRSLPRWQRRRSKEVPDRLKALVCRRRIPVQTESSANPRSAVVSPISAGKRYVSRCSSGRCRLIGQCLPPETPSPVREVSRSLGLTVARSPVARHRAVDFVVSALRNRPSALSCVARRPGQRCRPDASKVVPVVVKPRSPPASVRGDPVGAGRLVRKQGARQSASYLSSRLRLISPEYARPGDDVSRSGPWIAFSSASPV